MIFHFKKFSVSQEKSAMKIGTDGTLLATLTPIEQPKNILDIGAGTGVISLMLAQRSPLSKIDAVEIDPLAFEECSLNFQRSPWATSLKVFQYDFIPFSNNTSSCYDLIVSNPPFYTAHTQAKNSQRAIARSVGTLSFEKLLKGVAKLLTNNGSFSVIIPFSEQDNFITLAQDNSLFLIKVIHIRGNKYSAIKRSIVIFKKQKTQELSLETFTIEEQRGIYTAEYQKALRDFLIIF